MTVDPEKSKANDASSEPEGTSPEMASENSPVESVDSSATEKAFEEIEVGPESEPDENESIPFSESDSDMDVEALQQKIAEKDDQLLRAAAEIENVRKRGRREAEDARKYASTQLLNDLLLVVDDLNRAVESAESNEENSGLLAGVKMVAQQLETVLEKNHCKKIESLGNAFDPNFHEAIQMQPSEQYEANQVSLEARTGYQLHDRVLRTAQVFVSTGSPQPTETDSE